MKENVPTFVSVQVAVPPPSPLASTVYVPCDRATLRGKERDGSTVVLIEENRSQVARAIRGEAAGRGNRPDRTGASNKKRKSAVQ